jgi:WhiB family redox-sensing transcriptional regulator
MPARTAETVETAEGDCMDAPSRSSVMGHDDNAWRDEAACRGTALGLFFPEDGHPDARATSAAAKAVCASCPVAEPCREWAMGHPTEVGIWGGLTEAERRTLRRRKRSVA